MCLIRNQRLSRCTGAAPAFVTISCGGVRPGELVRSAAKANSNQIMILRSCESHLEAQNLSDNLKQLWDEEFQGPFPHADCQWLNHEFQGELDHLLPDLDLWVIDHIGFASRGRSLLEFSRDQALRARGLVSVRFFEQLPEYAWLERHVSESNTPDLCAYLDVSDRLRSMLLSLFDLMLKEQLIESRNVDEQALGADSPVSSLYR
jgi:hypothetical protein